MIHSPSQHTSEPSNIDRLRSPLTWAIVAGVTAIVMVGCVGAIYVGLYLAQGDLADSLPGSSIDGKIDGSCNANGINNVVSCKAQGPSMAGVKVSDMDVLGLWFDGPPDRLPPPPNHLVGRELGCRDEEYLQWLRSTAGFYFFAINKMVILTAGEPDLVTLTDTHVNISARKEVRAEQGTPIQCNWGGGGYVQNYMIEVDSQSQKATLYDVAESPPENPRPMPPAAVSLGEKAEAKISVEVKSKPNHAYTGSLTMTTSSNGKPATLRVGGVESPLRWVQFSSNDGQGYHYALDEAGEWVRNWQPY